MKVDKLTVLFEGSLWAAGIVRRVSLSGDTEGGKDLIVETVDNLVPVFYSLVNEQSKKLIKTLKVGDKVEIYPYDGSKKAIQEIKPFIDPSFLPHEFKPLNKRIDLE